MRKRLLQPWSIFSERIYKSETEQQRKRQDMEYFHILPFLLVKISLNTIFSLLFWKKYIMIKSLKMFAMEEEL